MKGLEAAIDHRPPWFQTAVFYEVLVRSFSDSNADGIGDLPGLTAQLDYLEWLGVDCLWLPPFYPSPLRDGGYDVADFTGVLPEVGTLDDFKEFLAAAHERGIRVITDFVMNHTSDQHPWFQASREDPNGPYGDFYVWSDTDDEYRDIRIIFCDTETSNWTWDPARKQFFWHRFFSHQPDLNFENPKVHDAILDAMRFWLDLGVDGFRLDAVPYLYVRPGTLGEHLPQTHEFLQRVRAFIDESYEDRLLLCEANGKPDQVVRYFGGTHRPDGAWAGDECHMAFDFPLMPQIFLALHRGQRAPISSMLRATEAIPADCQWGIFLRNHDELTLETVTDEVRDELLAAYAPEPRMRANVGIRRRLAPLLDGDMSKVQLATALLLSLPGSPVLYYGDEIGMGDNIWLEDRDSVRTPMQWTGHHNGGFSEAEVEHLPLPLVHDAALGFPRVNVATQRGDRSSLLRRTQEAIGIRKRHASFGLGTLTDLEGSNPAVLAFVRQYTSPTGQEDAVLCVYNLAPTAQATELDLSRWEGVTPVELGGPSAFPVIGPNLYPVTLSGYAFYWISLTWQIRQ
ncbi:MAG TPA: maltose alpha-D-glucosyltransferase [Marmoricola sp.]|nr:maltose alpha-D-glucosyltransferase [Marmoricola sp.]